MIEDVCEDGGGNLIEIAVEFRQIIVVKLNHRLVKNWIDSLLAENILDDNLPKPPVITKGHPHMIR